MEGTLQSGRHKRASSGHSRAYHFAIDSYIDSEPSSILCPVRASGPQSQGLLFGTAWGLYLVSDLLYPIAFPALYFALKQINRTAMLIAVLFNTMFVAIDVGIDIPLSLSLVDLSNSYASAQIGAQQLAYLATAQLTMDGANISALIATSLQFSAVILASYVMLRSHTFRKSPAYVGLVNGILSLRFIPAFILSSPLAGSFNIGGFVFLVI